MRSPYWPRGSEYSCEKGRPLVQRGQMPIEQRNKTHDSVLGHEPNCSTCKAENAVEERRFLSPVFRIDFAPKAARLGHSFAFHEPFSLPIHAALWNDLLVTTMLTLLEL